MRLLKVGRDAKCDITLSSPKVSSLHAEITLLDNGDIFLEDKNSLNGTFIMNQAIKASKPVKIRRGDAIRFADTELQWAQIPMPEDISAYKGIFGIGTHFNNSIQLTGATVSRYHATVKLAKDGKMYIVDHSMNGTTVDGKKITPNNPYRIKRRSSVVCGGVPADLSSLPWPTEIWKYIGGIAACIVVLVAIGFGVHKIINPEPKVKPVAEKVWDEGMILARYTSSVVMLQGLYHYEVEVEGLSQEFLEWLEIPTKLIAIDGVPVPISALTEKQFRDYYRNYIGTGFFVGDDGKIITNLHIVKPWLDDKYKQTVEQLIRRQFAETVENFTRWASNPRIRKYMEKKGLTGLSAYISQLKLVGVSDGIILLQNNKMYSNENAIKCTVLSAGEDLEKDVAIVKCDRGMLPDATYVNVADSINLSDTCFNVGKRIFYVGFPGGGSEGEDYSISAMTLEGRIIDKGNGINFRHSANVEGGASGAPVFDDHGRLIGIINARNEHGTLNYGIRAKYVKEMLDGPYKK